MAYQTTAITIKEAIEKITNRQYVLPSIQREFVWGTDQIETLFDSLMRDYPIGTFLFWEIGEQIMDFEFYAFLEKYHQKDNYRTPEANITNGKGVIAVLDGQQRMTSMYLALNRNGYYADKKPRMARKNPKAYPKRKLHLNLLKKSKKLEAEYDFQFLTQEEAKKQSAEDVNFYWFECHKILLFKKKSEAIKHIHESDDFRSTSTQRDFAVDAIDRFYDVVHKNPIINFYLEKSKELDKVLQIFIRINSAGTPLTYSDLLLSIATAKWEDKNAREAINDFLYDINGIGDGFNFNKDLVLKNCLVLAGLPDIRFKVDNFSKSNMKTIEANWGRISSSLSTAVQLVAKFGYSEKNLISTNAIIPIAYFIYKNEFEDQILRSSQQENQKVIKQWLARALLKGMFGGQPDSIYPVMRNLIDKNLGRFPLEEIIDHYKNDRRSISFSIDDIDTLLEESQYGKPKTYCVLSLVYPDLNHSDTRYEQDHIHPKSKFHKKTMRANKFSDDLIEQFNAQVNNIANLQLISDNQEKKDKTLEEWLDFKFPSDKRGKDRYLDQHHIKPDQSLEFKDFLGFIKERQKTIKTHLVSILGVTHEE